MGGGFGGRKAGFGGIGALVVVALVALVLGVDPRLLLEGTSGGAPYSYAPGEPPSTADDELAEFVSVVLADTEDTWSGVFERHGRTYREPTLVLFSDAVDSACGFAQADRTSTRLNSST